ncbi:MAG: efflux transporter outer membrane subunit [Holosporaceae bacterium]|jgi:multidrug efflux system outer membrane protein|nr:efflux transporter outer membrane subunit [Holosporaceae bacterium]
MRSNNNGGIGSLETIAVIMISSFVLTGCEVGPKYRKPKLDLPQLPQPEKETEKYVADKWWEVFSDGALNNLEERALKSNADLRQAVENVEIARAIAGVAFADLLPSVGISGDGKESYTSKNGPMAPLMARMSRSTPDHTLTIGAAYEIDFFGKYRRANEEARASLLASKAAKESVRLSVTADVAKAYFQLRALDAKLAIARRTLATRQKTCAVYSSRVENGYCTELDYLRVQAEMSSVKTVVLDLEASLAKIENSLSVLIGTSPREMMIRRTAKDQAIEKLRVPTEIPNGIPSDILSRRPDILQAEGLLIAANAKIGEARAAHFPSISLTGVFGFESTSLARLFNSGSDTWNWGGGVFLPIFNGGKITALNKSAEANYRKMLAAYEKTVQGAFREALDALITNRNSREVVISRTKQVNSLKKSYEIAAKQQDSGLIGLLDLLDVERGLLAAEMDMVSALQNRLNAVVDLCKALGGGWKAQRL